MAHARRGRLPDGPGILGRESLGAMEAGGVGAEAAEDDAVRQGVDDRTAAHPGAGDGLGVAAEPDVQDVEEPPVKAQPAE